MNHTHILAFWPHPDDVEVGAGGVIAQSSAKWYTNVIIDCTPSQLSTRWNPILRQQEAQQAATLLWATTRENLGRSDTEIRDDIYHREIVATKIREYQPELVLVPYIHDRHPDHEIVPVVVKNGIFLAWLAKKELIDDDGNQLIPRRPRMVLQYMIRDFFEPDIIVWIEPVHFETKMNAFSSYSSQTETNAHALSYIRGRAQTLGFQIKQDFGEWFKTFEWAVGIDCFSKIYTWFW